MINLGFIHFESECLVYCNTQRKNHLYMDATYAEI